ncbi:AidA/PixA family protein [Streptomyces sp. URMC 128]
MVLVALGLEVRRAFGALLQILDRHRQLKGYFQWDPFITIEDS